MSLAKLCNHVGCSSYCLEGHKYCSKHLDEEKPVDKPWSMYRDGKSPYQTFYSSKKWRDLKSIQLQREPICQKCHREQATEVHHVVAHRGDSNLFYDPNNLVSLCHMCHTRETLKEMQSRHKDRNKLWY